MEAIILAGGFGTRLKHIVPDIPKPMAPINNRPFLEYIFVYLKNQGITKVILATGYKSHCIKNYFGDKFGDIGILYSNEDSPLGTGGAIKQALQYCEDEAVFIINGDTYFDVDLKEMQESHTKNSADITIAVKEMSNYNRYGTVICKDQRIEKFTEKIQTEIGLINGGIYLTNKDVVNKINEVQFSFESDLLERYVNQHQIFSFMSSGYFIDIGIPEDYYKANKEFSRLLPL